MEEILFILNEPPFMKLKENIFKDMPFAESENKETAGYDFMASCGKHSTLAHILAAIKGGYEVLVYDQFRNPLCNIGDKLPVVRLNQENFGVVIVAYEEENNNLKEMAKEEMRKNLNNSAYMFDSDKILSNYAPKRARELLDLHKFEVEEIYYNRIKNVNTRVDPMLENFSKEDKEFCKNNGYSSPFKWSMNQYQQMFPQSVFNCPNDERIGDKVSPVLVDQELEAAGKDKIFTPTKEFSINDGNSERFAEAIREIIQVRNEMFSNKPTKIVLKPRDSAQSSGVFGYHIASEAEYAENSQGWQDLESLKNIPIATLKNDNLQLLKIKPNLSSEEMQEITNIMLYVQTIKANKELDLGKEIKDTTQEERTEFSKKLYDTEIQVQPFLDGIVNGDIRANIIKNGKGEWISVGHTFRAKVSDKEGEAKQNVVCDKNDNVVGMQFTSCYSAGKATSARIEFILSKEETKDLDEKTAALISILNGSLKDLYKNCREIGVDFIPVGDGKRLYLGEMNHTDPALMPLSEMLYQAFVEFVDELEKKKKSCNENEKKFLELHKNIKNNPPYPEFVYGGGLAGAVLYGKGQMEEQKKRFGSAALIERASFNASQQFSEEEKKVGEKL